MTIEERLRLVERRLQIYRGALLLGAVLLAAFVAWGQAKPVPDVIEAREFVVLDRETGAPVARLGQRSTGGALDIMNRETDFFVYMNVDGSGKGRLMLCTPEGAMRRDCTTWTSP